jgi:hypothetical protein
MQHGTTVEETKVSQVHSCSVVVCRLVKSAVRGRDRFPKAPLPGPLVRGQIWFTACELFFLRR